jgi:hypothetical protein
MANERAYLVMKKFDGLYSALWKALKPPCWTTMCGTSSQKISSAMASPRPRSQIVVQSCTSRFVEIGKCGEVKDSAARGCNIKQRLLLNFMEDQVLTAKF